MSQKGGQTCAACCLTINNVAICCFQKYIVIVWPGLKNCGCLFQHLKATVLVDLLNCWRTVNDYFPQARESFFLTSSLGESLVDISRQNNAPINVKPAGGRGEGGGGERGEGERGRGGGAYGGILTFSEKLL